MTINNMRAALERIASGTENGHACAEIAKAALSAAQQPAEAKPAFGAWKKTKDERPLSEVLEYHGIGAARLQPTAPAGALTEEETNLALMLASERRIIGDLYAPALNQEEADIFRRKLKKRGYILTAFDSANTNPPASGN